MSMVYGFAGTTSFAGLAQIFSGGGEVSIGVSVGLVFLSAGLAFKASAVPFHMWTPDVYEGAPTPVTAFFAVAPKVAAIALFVRAMVSPFGEIAGERSEEHTSELQSLMRISYAVFCLKKKKHKNRSNSITIQSCK